ncbi:hypothetical protein K469DRAFT_726230 [Zopfia rhizophila CBS 207.26]|uniref:Jacalin-type lectin domain-containing protein n=1 Tax=Zopfia rhizophila CBS 207.26 TaxID=1314779 RepID=A0A6A6E7L8_9PEZI|nr:hypothetical protein K469DRAFT_726230 [Zopfia rhizophila CBS 207.26]
MTAYMWQAMIAEDLRSKGLGRRSFRLDEEWAVDTVSRDFLNARYDDSLESEGTMRATAKEIRDTNLAQQNPSARHKDRLFDFFLDALKEAGGPFTSSAHPIVAGLILDSHYSTSRSLILDHAALGCHNPEGISLGVLGSHLTYAWPRLLEEVASCLTDTKVPGDCVGNDNGECCTMWEACTIGQGSHLREVGHAFGSSHRPEIMERGYAQDWLKNFLLQTAYCGRHKTAGVVVTDSTRNNARWHLSDALSFRRLKSFRLPSDQLLTPELRNAGPQAQAAFEGDEDLQSILEINRAAGIAQVQFNGNAEKSPCVAEPVASLRFTQDELESRFDRAESLTLTNVSKLLAIKSFVRIPGSNIRLFKRSVYSDGLENVPDRPHLQWAHLLKEKGPDGNIYRATAIDLRVGYGHKSHWGPMRRHGQEHSFGGHASEEIELPLSATIKKIEVNRAKGELNRSRDTGVVKLEPGVNEVIVGFHGKSARDSFCGVVEFGIITAPKEVGLDGLPEVTFNLSELRNTRKPTQMTTTTETQTTTRLRTTYILHVIHMLKTARGR